MQRSSNKVRTTARLYAALFLLGGVIHLLDVAWDVVDFTTCITQIYFSTLVLAWAITIRFRIVDPKIRRLMLITAALIMLQFFFQVCRYRLFEDFSTARRYLWYGYYVPFNLAPALFLAVVLRLHLRESESPGRCWLLMLIPSAAFALLVMTNDLHKLVFWFAETTEGSTGTYTHGLAFFVMYGWFGAVFALALLIAIRKSRLPGLKGSLWLPLYACLLVILCICGFFEVPKIAGTALWMAMEPVYMTIVFVEELCIQLGLIPANSSYQAVFRLSKKPVIVRDCAGSTVYTSPAAEELFRREDAVQLHTRPIQGGSVSWAVDLSDMMALNRELEKAAEGIESRNELLRSENALKEEQSSLAARNMVYTRIARIISPQLGAIQELIRGDSNRDLAKIVVLCSYIKRRSNMELLLSGSGDFPPEELAAAIRESCEYLKLCEVNAMLFAVPECSLSGKMQTALYEVFEAVLEECLDTLQSLLVNITVRGTDAILRMTLRAGRVNTEAMEQKLLGLETVAGFSAEAEGSEAAVAITVREGGIAK